jgi:hypothetical protein
MLYLDDLRRKMMNPYECTLKYPLDHIMANTWRLILAQNLPRPQPNPVVVSPVEFQMLEAALPDYRLIGICLADDDHRQSHPQN